MKIFSNRKLLLHWLLSYISILLVPICISGIIYAQSAKVVENEINAANENVLRLVQKAIDSRINEVKRVYVQIALNDYVERLLEVKTEFQRSERTKLLDAAKVLSMQQSVSSIKNLYIYFKRNHCIFNGSLYTDTRLFYDITYQDSKMSYSQWTKLIEGTSSMQFVPMNVKYEDGRTVKMIACINSLPVVHNQKPSGTLVETIEESDFKQIMDDIRVMHQQMIFVIDSNNRILISSGYEGDAEAFASFEYDRFGKDYEDFNHKVKGNDYVISYISSRAADWKYIIAVPSKLFWEKVEYIKKLSLWGILICILVGGMVAYVFARKNYNPLDKIIKALLKNEDMTFNSNYREYIFIQDAIKEAREGRKAASQKLAFKSKILKSFCLERLLKGTYNSFAPIRELLQFDDLKFDTDDFAVLLIYIDDFVGFKNLKSDTDYDNNFSLVKFVITNVFEELVGKNHGCYFTEVDGMPVCIINYKGSAGYPFESEMKDIIKNAQQFIKEKFSICFSASFSNVQKGIEALSVCYHEALDAMEYRIFLGTGDVAAYGDIKKKQEHYNFSILLGRKLMNHIKEGDFDMARSLVEEYFIESFSNATFSDELAKCLIFDITSTLIKILDELGDLYIIESSHPIKRLLNCKTIAEMKQQVIGLLREACSYIREKNTENNPHISDEIMDYIELNYRDMNLCVGMIGEKYNLSIQYVSQIFKKETGQLLSDTINMVRVKKAAELLKDTSVCIGDIAVSTGFSNSSVLIRTFKKIEGITPGRYREIYGNSVRKQWLQSG